MLPHRTVAVAVKWCGATREERDHGAWIIYAALHPTN